jgi:hypothetical protein
MIDSTNISEKYAVSIFRAEKILQIEVAYSSETSIFFCQIA